jgi:hypothetical protein
MNRGFGADLAAGRTAAVQVIVDGTDSNTAAVVLDYAARITQAYSKDVLDMRAHRRAPGTDPAAGRRGTGVARLVQRQPREPELLRARRHRDHRAAHHADADEHGRRAGEGDRHDGADHRDADHARRVHPRQDGAVRPDRARRRPAHHDHRRGLVRESRSAAACWCSSAPRSCIC